MQVDEAKNLHDKNDRLKNAITGYTILVEHKGKDAITMANLANFLFTTNNEDCFNIAPDDRRMCMFRCSDKKRGDKAYFQRLADHLDTVGVNVAFYKYLKTRDLSAYRFDFSESRPITEFYEEIRLLSIQMEKRFMSGIVNARNDILRFNASDLYSNFCAWSESEKHRFYRAQNKFGMIVKRIFGVVTARESHGNVYTVDCAVVRKTLQDSREFDPNVVIMEFQNYPSVRVVGL